MQIVDLFELQLRGCDHVSQFAFFESQSREMDWK